MVQDIVKNNKAIKEICEKNGITFLGLFGSLAQGKDNEQSDVDLLISYTGEKSLLDLVRIERELTHAVGREVDLLTKSSLSKYLRKQIESDIKVIYDK